MSRLTQTIIGSRHDHMPVYRIQDRNILFIHVPKTGGTSIERFLERASAPALHNQGQKLLRPTSSGLLAPSLAMQHCDRKLLEGMFPGNFFDHAFMIVRHPLDRLVSEYWHSRTHDRLDSRLPFNAWARIALTAAKWEPHFRNNHFLPQAMFECFDADVYKFEDGIDKIIHRLCKILDSPAPDQIPHEKKTISSEVKISKSTKYIIEKFYRTDYDRFGY